MFHSAICPFRRAPQLLRAIFSAGAGLAVALVLLAPRPFTALAQNQPPQVLRFVEGVDAAPVPMAAGDVAAQLNDPWGALVLRKVGMFPGNVDEVLAALNKLNQDPGGVPQQASFFVSETGLIPVNASTAHLRREFRAVVSRSNSANSAAVLVSIPAGDREGLIELMSWDATKQAFNFYRRPKLREWHWKGDSRDAFRAASTGNGCFKCHVHGAPIMKELRLPWNNWSTQDASFPREAITSPEIRDSPLFAGPPAGTKQPADKLEPIIRAWTHATVDGRMSDLVKSSTLPAAPDVVRPLFETLTVNLGSSGRLSASSTPTLDLPANFFVNADALGDVVRVQLPPVPQVKRDIYAAALAKFDFRLAEGPTCNAANFCLKGDTHFAFFVPVPSVGDVDTIRQLIDRKIITPHFALSVLMVDFPNPIYSASRSSLLRYVPPTATVQNGASDLPDKTAAAIVQAAAGSPADSPERQFAANWQRTPDDLRADAAARIKSYFAAVGQRLATQAGFDDFTRLAEARRQKFATSGLDEFPLLLPKTNLPAAALRMRADATVTP